jgi:serine/threonine protein phosphatase 1
MIAFFRRSARRNEAARELPRVADGERVYVIGDIHGRSDLLKKTLAAINEHLAHSPAATTRIVFLGDYVDRGPDTSGVLDIIAGLDGRDEVVLLAGNHEQFMLSGLENFSSLGSWLWAGGREALLSYDIRISLNASEYELGRVFNEARERIPAGHMDVLRRLRSYHVSGDYAFVHAGIRPGIPLEEQDARDLLWIREEFINYTGRHPYFIVHGHTPVEEPDIRSNRINIDTGAYITGSLTCLILEGTTRSFL